MDDLQKFYFVNTCETAQELSKLIEMFADKETGLIQGRRRQFSAGKMASYVQLVIDGSAPANVLTREWGIRQQALYIKYCLDNSI